MSDRSLRHFQGFAKPKPQVIQTAPICGRLVVGANGAPPMPDADVSGGPTWAQYNGDLMPIYTPRGWQLRNFRNFGFDIDGTYDLYDAFAKWNGYQVVGEVAAWTANQTGNITNVTNASPPVITANNTLAAGDIVSITNVIGAAANGVFRVASPSGTQFTLNTLAGGNPPAPGVYTSGGVYERISTNTSRTHAIERNSNGLWVHSDYPKWLYLGTFRLGSLRAQTDDKIASRLTWSAYNRARRKIKVVDVTDNWDYATAAWRVMRNDLANRVEIVVGLTDASDVIDLRTILNARTTSAPYQVGVGIDALSTNSADLGAGVNADGGTVAITSAYTGSLTPGFHIIYPLEYGGTGVRFYGDSALSGRVQSGLIGTIFN